MIISTLNKVISEMNATRVKRGLKPISSDNGISNAMKRAGFYVSRPTISKLRNNTPLHPVKSIDFKTLDNLCQFFNKGRVQDFFHYVGSYTDIAIQSLDEFKKTHYLKHFGLKEAILPKGCTVVLVHDSHDHFHTHTHWDLQSTPKDKKKFTYFKNPQKHVVKNMLINGSQKYLLIFIPRFVQTGIHKSHNSYTIQCAYMSCLTSNHSLDVVQDALIDIFSHIDKRERILMDSLFINNLKKHDTSPLWRSLQRVPVQDGFGTIYIKSDSIAVPKFAYALSSDINDSSYNFRFFNKID